MWKSGAALYAEYNRLWATPGSSTKVREALGLRDGEHYELAAWGLLGAARVVAHRSHREGR